MSFTIALNVNKSNCSIGRILLLTLFIARPIYHIHQLSIPLTYSRNMDVQMSVFSYLEVRNIRSGEIWM